MLFKLIFIARAFGVQIPSVKIIGVRLKPRRIWNIESILSQLGLVLNSFFVNCVCGAVFELQLVTIAQIIEIKSIIDELLCIIFVKVRNISRIASEALYFVIFLIVGRIIKICIDLLHKVKISRTRRPRSTAYSCTNLLHVVIYGLLDITALIIQIERSVETRHTVKRLQSIVKLAAIRAFPCAAAVGGVKRSFAKFIGNPCVVFCRNGRSCGIAFITMVMEKPLIARQFSKRQRICISLEIHVQHGRAICLYGHGFGLSCVIGKMSIIASGEVLVLIIAAFYG